jgi:hypothetical protein
MVLLFFELICIWLVDYFESCVSVRLVNFLFFIHHFFYSLTPPLVLLNFTSGLAKIGCCFSLTRKIKLL